MKLDSEVIKRERTHFLNFIVNHPEKQSVTKLPKLADELSSLDLDHIPALRLESGLQYQNYLLSLVAYEISEFRAVLPRKMIYLSRASKALQHAKALKLDHIYLLTSNKIKNISLKPLTYQQIKSYLQK